MRARHVLTAIGVATLICVAGVVANDERSPQRGERGAGERESAVVELWSGRRVTTENAREEITTRASNSLRKAGSLLAAAESLRAEGRTDEAIRLFDRVVTMELPAGREADKLVTKAYLSLGDLYNAAEMDPAKAVAFYASAIQRMDVEEDNLSMVHALGVVVEIHAGLGDRVAAAEAESMRHDAQLGIAPVEIGSDAASAGVTPVDTGDDTCAASVGISVPHSETMSVRPAFDQNWRDFTLTEPRIVIIETVDPDTTKDTQLDLWAGCTSGNPTSFLATDDDGGAGLLSRIESTCLDPGRYWIKVFAFADRTPQHFVLSVTDRECPPPVGADSYEPDDEPAQAKKIGFRNNGNGEGGQNGRDNKQIQRHTIYPAGELDWMRFSLSRANWVRIETLGVDGGNPDTIVGAINAGGKLFAVNDDKAPGDFTSGMEFCLPSGDYYTAALGFFADDQFHYDAAVDVQGSCRMEQEPNGSCELANDLPAGESWNALHNPFGLTFEQDWWRITVEERSLVTIAAGGYDDFDVDTFFELYNGCAGALVAFNDDGGPGFMSRIEAVLDPGTYYLMVRLSPLGPPGDMFPYSLTVELSEPPQGEIEPNNNCGQANPVELGDSLLAAIAVTGDKDFFLLNVPSATLVDIETNGPFGDTVLDISASSGNPQIGCDDDSGTALFSRWNCCLPPGTYCVGVKDFGNNNPIPNYNIEFRGVGTCNPSLPLTCRIDSSGQCPHPF